MIGKEREGEGGKKGWMGRKEGWIFEKTKEQKCRCRLVQGRFWQLNVSDF